MAHSVGPGFQTYAQQNNLTLLSDECYVVGDQVSYALTDKGMLVYTKDDNQVHFIPFGSPN